MNDLTVFDFEKKKIRTIMIDGEPWFVAMDVAKALGYSWNGGACIAHIPELWKGVRSVLTPGGNQAMTVISEPGFYFFLGRSDKPAALPMQMWAAGEVFPAIRKIGAYGRRAIDVAFTSLYSLPSLVWLLCGAVCGAVCDTLSLASD